MQLNYLLLKETDWLSFERKGNKIIAQIKDEAECYEIVKKFEQQGETGKETQEIIQYKEGKKSTIFSLISYFSEGEDTAIFNGEEVSKSQCNALCDLFYLDIENLKSKNFKEFFKPKKIC